ncbi:50S ribosomal protein L4 [Candidatus Saccharibacteria bacterium RIFCSPHIGHO2_02_FULL_47_12]|nr:MAG: 50S ribosomal protein L4 [Candidatus Saccharibacteria bacterium RIFCSPHIGHO2_02_FULL_47_12]
MSAATFTSTGTKSATPAKLDKKVFAVDVKNHELLKTAYLAYLANARVGAPAVKTRGLVRGGGVKPWRQKGTGRARVGSSRTPLWRGGGIIFGPTGLENHTKKISTSSKRTALRQALTLAEKAGKINVIEKFNSKDGKVSATVKLLEKMGLLGKTLIVVNEWNDLVDRATRNIPNLSVKRANYLSVYDILNADHLLITNAALETINGWLGSSPAKVSKESSEGKA